MNAAAVDQSSASAVERLGIGLAVLALGVALFVGLPPPWWPDMPPAAVRFGVGAGIILIFIGVALILNSAWIARRGRRMWPVIGMAFFGFGFLGCAAWYFWPAKATGEIAPNGPAVPLGSFAYEILAPEIQASVPDKTASVRLIVDLKNNNPFLLKYHAKLRGSADGKTPANEILEFDGYAAAGAISKLIYNRIDAVPLNPHPSVTNPTLAGTLEYDVTYWAAEALAGQKRRTSRRCDFEMRTPIPSEDLPAGSVTRTTERVTVRLSNEIEE